MGRLLWVGLVAVVLMGGGLATGVAQASAGRSSAAKTHASADAGNGQAVFQHACVMCHAVQPGVKIVGPSLAGVLHGPHAMTLAAAKFIILNGKGKMPPERGRLSDQEIADVLAYLKTL